MSSPELQADLNPRALGVAVRQGLLVWMAFALAVAGLAGSLFLSWGLGLKACPLCFYQRTFMMSLVAILGMSLFGLVGVQRLSLLALPLAVAGLGVAGFHVFLEMQGRLECPQGVWGLGTAPAQSLGMFVVIAGLLLADVIRSGGAGGFPLAGLSGGTFLGVVLAYCASTSNPAPPPAPPGGYSGPPDVCRPPYKGS